MNYFDKRRRANEFRTKLLNVYFGLNAEERRQFDKWYWYNKKCNQK